MFLILDISVIFGGIDLVFSMVKSLIWFLFCVVGFYLFDK